MSQGYAPIPDRPGDRATHASQARAMGWVGKAACAGMNTEDWYPEHGGGDRKALTQCFKCQVRDACLSYSVKHEKTGIWGGCSAEDRWRVRRGEVTLAQMYEDSFERWIQRNRPYRRVRDRSKKR